MTLCIYEPELVTKAVGQLHSVHAGIAVDELANKLYGIGMGKLPLDLTAG